VINSSDDVESRNAPKDDTSGSCGVCIDADSAMPSTSFSQLNGKKLDEPSTVLCGNIPGIAMIVSSGNVASSNSFEDETSLSGDEDSA
jgi:hypothetical protein